MIKQGDCPHARLVIQCSVLTDRVKQGLGQQQQRHSEQRKGGLQLTNQISNQLTHYLTNQPTNQPTNRLTKLGRMVSKAKHQLLRINTSALLRINTSALAAERWLACPHAGCVSVWGGACACLQGDVRHAQVVWGGRECPCLRSVCVFVHVLVLACRATYDVHRLCVGGEPCACLQGDV